MTPRADVFALDEHIRGPERALRIAQSRYSRVPIYRDTLDNVVGMIHAFDVLKDTDGEHVRLRPVAEAPDHGAVQRLPVPDAARAPAPRRRARRAPGDSAGIVTLEDLLEELVGDIRDEHDEPGTRRRARFAMPGRLAPCGRRPNGTHAQHATRDDFHVARKPSSSPISTRAARPRSRAPSASSRTSAGIRHAARRAAPANRPRAAHRHHRAAGRREEHAHDARSPHVSRRGAHGRHRRGRSDVAVHRRRAARRSHPHGERRARSRACTSDRSRRAARSADSSAATREVARRARRVRLRSHPHRDGRRRAERARHRAHGRHDASSCSFRSRATRSRRSRPA